MAGVEGLEPPTYGFGDHNSNQLSHTPVLNYLLRLFMKYSLAFTWAKFNLLNTTRMLSLIFFSRIVTLVTRCTFKNNNFSWHFVPSLYKKKEEAPKHLFLFYRNLFITQQSQIPHQLQQFFHPHG
jgi:hypothetical protein